MESKWKKCEKCDFYSLYNDDANFCIFHGNPLMEPKLRYACSNGACKRHDEDLSVFAEYCDICGSPVEEREII